MASSFAFPLLVHHSFIRWRKIWVKKTSSKWLIFLMIQEPIYHGNKSWITSFLLSWVCLLPTTEHSIIFTREKAENRKGKCQTRESINGKNAVPATCVGETQSFPRVSLLLSRYWHSHTEHFQSPNVWRFLSTPTNSTQFMCGLWRGTVFPHITKQSSEH